MKVCALLCAVALSANTVLPAMAAENVENTQETMIEVEENQPVEEQNVATGNETESKSADEQQEQENAGQQDEVNQQEQASDADDAQNEVKEETQEMPSSNELEADASEEDGIPENGWYYENGFTYYYENGVKVTGMLKEISDEDGNTYGYYFDWDGRLQINCRNYVNHIFEDLTYIQGWVRSDENGHLYQDSWYNNGGRKEYYGQDYVCPTGKKVIIDENLYYFDENGYLVTDNQVMIGDQLYKADENGVLSLIDTGKDTRWVLGNGNWYYLEDGVPVKNSFREINGSKYYFDGTGKMQTGLFSLWGDADGSMVQKYYLAESSGEIIEKSNSWYYSNDNQKWYYFDQDGNPVNNKIEIIAGKEYYFNDSGELQTGFFYYHDISQQKSGYLYADALGEICRENNWYYNDGKWYYVTENGESAKFGFYTIKGKEYYFDYNGVMQTGAFSARNFSAGQFTYYYADKDGVVDKKEGWKLYGNNRYYVQNDGTLATDGIKEIAGNKYYFGYSGIMQTGKIQVNGEFYYANSSGAFACNQWIKSGFEWFFAGKDGKLLTSQWVDDDYYFGDAGVMAVGVVKTDKGTYLFDDNGHKKEEVGTTKGWQLVDGDWYYYDEPGEPHNGWLDNKWYIEDGKMLIDTFVISRDGEGESWVGVDGLIQNGWIGEGYEWYYSEKGKIVNNDWRFIGNTWYYFTFSGLCEMSAGIREIDGKIHQFDRNGAWLGEVKTTGWFKSVAGNWYWINEDGTLNKETKKKIGNLEFYFSSYDGSMLSNAAIYGQWINGNGNLDTSDGWKRSGDGEWYYQENGKLVNGKKVIGGREYQFFPRMRANEVVQEQNGYVYYDENGIKSALTNGWYYLKTYNNYSWYYFVNGAPAKGWLNGYYFEYGRMSDGILWDSLDNIYMFDENGHLVKNQWTFRWGNWYYASASGRLYTGERTINGAKYWFGEDGVWIK